MGGRGHVHAGWALAEQGSVEEGIAQLRQALDIWRAIGTELGQTHILFRLAEAYGKGGQVRGQGCGCWMRHWLPAPKVASVIAKQSYIGSKASCFSDGVRSRVFDALAEAGTVFVMPWRWHATACEIFRTPGSDEFESAVAATGQTRGSLPVAGGDL